MQKFCKVRDPCHYTGEYRSPTYSICNLKYSAPKKNYIVFHNGSNYDNHFITNELAEELLKKHNIYSSNRNRNYRFMTSSLSNLVNNFSEEIHRIKCKYEHDDKK